MSSSVDNRDQVENVARAAEALLREHPDALVCGLSGNGLIVPIPQTVGVWGQAAIEGRAVFDGVVAEDRKKVVELWMRAQEEGAAAGPVRMLDKPTTWVTLHFLDVREIHEVVLCVILPGAEEPDESGEIREVEPATPRFATLLEDENARVIESDEAFTQMFGYTPEELIGNSVLDQIHPDDQGRAVEGWLAALSTRRAQQTRLRRKRKDGSWVWVDTTLHNFLNEPDRNYVLVELIDVTAEMSAQEALQEREELLRRLTEAMPVGLLQLDVDGDAVYHNARLLSILHGSGSSHGESAPGSCSEEGEEAPRGTAILRTLTDEGRAVFDAALREVLETGVDREIEVDIVLRSGVWKHALMTLRTLLRPTGEVSGAIVCVLDVTDSARARRELEKRATFDSLTRCRNRASILSAVQQELELDGSPEIGVVYVDLDKFKPVNDSLGHAAGDELLALVAERLKVASRANDDVGRLGGDEFLVLLRDIPGRHIAMQVAQRISDSLRRPFDLSGGSVQIGASVGVACTGADGTSAEELVRRSDAAMYRSKQAGDSLPVLSEDRHD
jgi:diguanylate cyclase (GGDEF)-like protein/PAS domain S-box-containing protein